MYVPTGWTFLPDWIFLTCILSSTNDPARVPRRQHRSFKRRRAFSRCVGARGRVVRWYGAGGRFSGVHSCCPVPLPSSARHFGHPVRGVYEDAGRRVRTGRGGAGGYRKARGIEQGNGYHGWRGSERGRERTGTRAVPVHPVIPATSTTSSTTTLPGYRGSTDEQCGGHCTGVSARVVRGSFSGGHSCCPVPLPSSARRF